MIRPVVVVEPGQGDRVGNVEFLARTVDTPFFNLGIVRLAPGQGVDGHVHRGEDDSWLVLEGTLSVTLGEEGKVLHAGPGTFVLVPAGTYHALHNQGPGDVRFLNVHAPGGFDRRIGWKPRRMIAGLALLVSAALLVVGVGGPASAAGLTKAKVQQISAKVLQQQAPKLRVAHATTADLAMQATTADRAREATTAGRAAVADDAATLGGRAPGAYLDRIAHGRGGMTSNIGAAWVPLMSPVTIAVPDGVELVRATGLASFGAHTERVGNSAVTVVHGGSCTAEPNPPESTGASPRGAASVTIDRVVPVHGGPATFVLCGYATVPSFAMNPSLVVETVAAGPTG